MPSSPRPGGQPGSTNLVKHGFPAANSNPGLPSLSSLVGCARASLCAILNSSAFLENIP